MIRDEKKILKKPTVVRALKARSLPSSMGMGMHDQFGNCSRFLSLRYAATKPGHPERLGSTRRHKSNARHVQPEPISFQSCIPNNMSIFHRQN